MLAGTEDRGPGPNPRYFHAAAYVPSCKAMYVLGGLTADGVFDDFWLLNLTTLQWRLLQVTDPEPLIANIRTQAQPDPPTGSPSPALCV